MKTVTYAHVSSKEQEQEGHKDLNKESIET